jgi:hypothetical protein
VLTLPLRRTLRRSLAICAAAGKQTVSGVVCWLSITRISLRLRLRSRLQARVCGVGAGGKTALFKQRGNGLVQGLLVVFDREDVIAPRHIR